MTAQQGSATPDGPYPPEEGSPLSVLTVPGTVVNRYDVQDVLGDVLRHIEPDVVVGAPPNEVTVGLSRLNSMATGPVVVPSRTDAVIAPEKSEVCLRFLPTASSTSQAQPDTSEPDATDHIYIISDELTLTIDPNNRETRLEGVQSYLDALPDRWHGKEQVSHLSTRLRAGFGTQLESTEVAQSIYGAGPPLDSVAAAIDDQTQSLYELSLYRNGAVQSTEYRPENFGLRGLEGVGQTRATTLREGGYRTHRDIADASVPELASLQGLGETTAKTIKNSATAIADGTVVPREGGTIPNGEPVFIDIETTGLSGDMPWLVGVLDGDSDDGRYLPFRQQSHDEPVTHLEDFMAWLSGPAQGRPVVAYNGYEFDFPAIRTHLEAHSPDWVEAWENRYQFDPLYYSKMQDNATLPGRNNKLETVAKALGWEPTSTGIDGAFAAAEYNAWRRTADTPDGYEPDWERLETYCEDDVRALATIHEALQAADEQTPAGRATSSSSTQGTLTDF